MRAEDQIIHHLKDKVGFGEADRLIAAMKTEHAHQLAEQQRAIPLSGVEAGVRDAVANHIDPKERP